MAEHKQQPRVTESVQQREELIRRRRFLQAGIGVSVVLGLTGLSALSVTGSLRPITTLTPDREPPAEGDRLVLAERQDHLLTLADLAVGRGGLLAYPLNPSSHVVKSGTLDNLIVLARLPPEELSQGTRLNAADGVVAYSAICTHLGCTTSLWNDEKKWFHCPCHHAMFDPAQGASVVQQPAPRPLPALPLRLESDTLVVAGSFLSPVGVI